MKVVLSGVNLVEGGPLSVYRSAIKAFSKKDCQIVCLVNRSELFQDLQSQNVQFIEFEYVKKSWLKRVFFEYFKSYFLSKELKPDVWVSLHDISPKICSGIEQYVYCHNASPFYKPTLKDFIYSKKFFLFALFYKYLYRINIKANKAVITQQSWFAKYFIEKGWVDRAIVARPIDNFFPTREGMSTVNDRSNKVVSGFYPTMPRTFKNIEIIIEALKICPEIADKLEIIITISQDQSIYARDLIESAKNISNIIFVGYLDSSELNKYYSNSDFVLFPSKLETWGLPISEAKLYRKDILLSDLAYAREALGDYDRAKFFNPESVKELSDIFIQLASGEKVFGSVKYEQEASESFVTLDCWEELADFLISHKNLSI
ncbi:glycosyltransferase [Aeromonas veronii]|uniref:glycosyltransferase n=1 Tax=Aeromonas veronii TaxID=654 RepID=UPI003004D403